MKIISILTSNINRRIMLKFILLCSILGFSLILRLYGLNWDQGFHMHPDERFLTMVAVASKIPINISSYLDPKTSTLNPYNIGYPFYVYGMFPLIIMKLLAVRFGLDDYYNLTLLGRGVSAILDTAVVLYVYALVKLWEKEIGYSSKTKYLAAFLYGIAVLPIQHAHFFVVDPFLNFFIFASIYHIFRFYYKNNRIQFVLACTFFGFAIASKITAIFAIPLFVYLLLAKSLKQHNTLWRGYMYILLFTILIYMTLRFTDPKIFESAHFLDVSMNKIFIENIVSLKSFDNNSSYPPGVQWFDKKPVIFPLQNIAFFGLGIPYFALMIIGFIALFIKGTNNIRILILWICAFFVYQSTRFATSMRYFLLLYPFFAISAGFGLYYVYQKLFKHNKLLFFILIIIVCIWPAAFMRIYTRPHSRVTASFWIYQNIPAGSFLAQEHWDDWLPLPVTPATVPYTGVQMPVFSKDTTEKVQSIESALKQADYIVFTSNRGYGSIMPQPNLFPFMSKQYRDLFAQKSNFKLVKEITSYPALCISKHCFEFDDQWAEEAFTVYDHPKVMIFNKK